MKTLQQLHREEQFEAIVDEWGREMQRIESDHIKAMRRIDLFVKGCEVLIYAVLLSPIIFIAVRALLRK